MEIQKRRYSTSRSGVFVHRWWAFAVVAALIVALFLPGMALANDDVEGPQPTSQTETPTIDSTEEAEDVVPVVPDGPGRYIVQLRGDVSQDLFFAERRAWPFQQKQQPGLRFNTVINGFVATLTAAEVKEMRRDSRVIGLMPDFEVTIQNQTIPTGVRRVGATTSGAAKIDGVDDLLDIDVAVLDTGVSAHSDLRIAGGVDCTGSGSYADGHGHGTHVAGTIAAIDNGSGVVGVAPGARIWSVRVLNSNGSGTGSMILCGIDWITARANIIEVANMSLAGVGMADDNNCGKTNGDIVHQAICKSVAAGVTYVAAAGNNGKDAAGYFPASYDEVITVSALADTDGLPGGLGPTSSYGADDRLASFSNYGPDVDVIAPGVSIYSTTRNGGYGMMSGTSMAAPHVAGAAALYKLTNPAASPAAVRSALISTGNTTTWSGDKDSFKEPLIDVSTFGGAVSPPPPATIDAAVTSVSMPTSVTQGSSVIVTVAVKNNGSASATIAVQLTGSPNGYNQTQNVSVAAGQTSNVTFSWATTSSTAIGTHTFAATATLSGDSNASNNTGSVTTSVVAPSSSTPTMSVSALTLTSSRVTFSSYRLTSHVTIRSDGAAVSGATVTVRFTNPRGNIDTMTATTNSSGVATFTRTVTQRGTHSVTVTNVVRSGYTYNAAGNVVTTRSITI